MESEKASTSPTPNGDRYISAVKDGDIILALPKSTNIRVSSVVLKNASPVFAVMLGPQFREGQGQSTAAAPKEIALVDDDPDSMMILCALLHSQHGVQATIRYDRLDETTFNLFKLADVVDKYECADAIELQTQTLFARFTEPGATCYVTDAGICNLITAAYLLNQPRLFALFTRRLALDRCSSFSMLVGCESGSRLPIIILRKYSRWHLGSMKADQHDSWCGRAPKLAA